MWVTNMAAAEYAGGDKIVYFGVINVNEGGKTVGAVDIWRSVITKELFCEEKRLGVLGIADYIGMPKIDKDKKWAVAINRKRNGPDKWKLVKLVKQGKFKFIDTDDESSIEVDVKEYKFNDSEWWSFLVEKNVNLTVDVTNEKNAR
ncbi:MAG TPA: hypothetical protein VEH06_04180 [Candidatus Bathyarchaeia archaeon]|jgi:hypothetical protein|nr:hypothetical protein [Candidatus Bathyarchaeia archaeon]